MSVVRVGCVGQPITGTFPNMGKQSSVETRFRERVKRERERRGWSQSDLAKRLSVKGIHSIYATTVAKIESGDRAVRIDEAAALADLFDVSTDALMGRAAMAERDRLYAVKDAAQQAAYTVGGVVNTLINVFPELDGLEFDNSEAMLAAVGRAQAALTAAVDALSDVAHGGHAPTLADMSETIGAPAPKYRKRSERAQ